MHRKTTTFTRGSGVYACRVCNRNTRDDGCGDSVGVRLCTQCYELSGLENIVQDGGELTDGDRSTIKANVTFLQSKHANVSAWTSLFADVLGA